MSTTATSAKSPNLLDLLNVWRTHERNRIHEGFLVVTSTTPSSQAKGNGNTTWNVNVSTGLVTVDGVVAEIAAQVDFSIHSGSEALNEDESLVAAIVAWLNTSGVVALAAVEGDPAITGQQLAPVDGAITSELGETCVAWVKLAHCLLNRTTDGGDEGVVTQSQDNKVRPFAGATTCTELFSCIGSCDSPPADEEELLE